MDTSAKNVASDGAVLDGGKNSDDFPIVIVQRLLELGRVAVIQSCP